MIFKTNDSNYAWETEIKSSQRKKKMFFKTIKIQGLILKFHTIRAMGSTASWKF